MAGGARRPQPRCCCHPLWQREIISARAAAREGSACRTATVALAAPHIGGLMAGPPTPPAPPPPPPPGAPSALRTGAPPAVPNARPPPCSCSCGSSNRASLHEQQRGRRGGDRPRGRAPSTISHARWLCSEADGALQRRWGGAGKKALGRGGGRGLTGGSAPRVAPSCTGPRAPARAERSSRAGTPARRSAPTKNHSRGGAAMHTPAVSACAKCASQGECLASPPPRSSCARQIYAPPRGVSECPGPHKPCVCASTRARCPIIICVIIDSLTTRRARR